MIPTPLLFRRPGWSFRPSVSLLMFGLCSVMQLGCFTLTLGCCGSPAAAQMGGDFSRPPDPRKDKKKEAGPDPATTDRQPTAPGAPAQGGKPLKKKAPSSSNPSDSPTPDMRDEGQKLFGAPGDSGAGTPVAGESGWSIVLETFKGENAAHQAMERQRVVGEIFGRSDLAIRVRENGCALVLGSYASAKDERAQRDLKMVRDKEISAGLRPWTGAFFAAPRVQDRGESPDMELTSARRLMGSATLFTLQVGVYETPDKPEEAKRAAEKAAKVLRDGGEKAFYYHGPRRSMVTIGLFGQRDFDEKSGRARNPEIARLRKEYPLNLLNGQYPILMGGGKQQTSELVKVP